MNAELPNIATATVTSLSWIGEIADSPSVLVEPFLPDIKRGLILASDAKAAKDAHESGSKAAKAILEPIFRAIGVKSAGIAQMGTASLRGGKNTTISRQMLEVILLARGIAADEVCAIIDSATVEKTYEYIEFRRDKGKKMKGGD